MSLDGSTTSSSSSSSPSPDQIILSSTLPVPSINPSGVITTNSTATNGYSDNDSITNSVASSCTRLASARDYAFVDCSEVYLSGKRTSGIYEIW